MLVESEGKRALVTGDTSHHRAQVAHPDWALGADNDKAAAVATPSRLLDTHAGGGMLFIGTHWVGGSCGYVERDGANFRLRVED